jgi:hypothetical protein
MSVGKPQDTLSAGSYYGALPYRFAAQGYC